MTAIFKAVIQPALRRLNVDVGRFRSRRTLDGFLAWALDRYHVGLLLDVGANEGQFARRVRRLGYQGRICSFEPVPSTFARLTESRTGDPNWSGVNIAVGRESGEAGLWYSDDHPDMASLHRASPNVPPRFAAWHRSEARRLTVPVRRLDDVDLDRLGGTSDRVFIKSDTQGHDLDVLKGATGLLERTDLVMVEAAVVGLYDEAPDIIETLRTLQGLGFQPAAFFPVTSIAKFAIPVVEFDVVACRSERR